MTPEDQEQFDQLKRQMRVLETRLQAADDLMGRLLYNGLDDMLKGHGNQYFGGGIMRADQTGFQFATGGTTTRILYFLNNFFTGSVPALPGGTLSGYATAAAAVMELAATTNMVGSGGASAEKTVLGQDASGEIYLSILDGSGNALSGIRIFPTYAEIRNVPLRMARLGADPASPEDGDDWYRTDTDKRRARINSVTENLATESWVAAAGGGFADHLMLMGA